MTASVGMKFSKAGVEGAIVFRITKVSRVSVHFRADALDLPGAPDRKLPLSVFEQRVRSRTLRCSPARP